MLWATNWSHSSMLSIGRKFASGLFLSFLLTSPLLPVVEQQEPALESGMEQHRPSEEDLAAEERRPMDLSLSRIHLKATMRAGMIAE